MIQIDDHIQLFTWLSYGCLGFCLGFLIIAIIFFFYYDIRSVLVYLTGRRAGKIRRIRRKHWILLLSVYLLTDCIHGAPDPVMGYEVPPEENVMVELPPDTEEDLEKPEPPRFQIIYNEAYRVVSDEGKCIDSEVKVPQTGYTAYYKGDIHVTVVMEEDYHPHRDDQPDVQFVLYKDGNALTGEAFPDFRWTRKDEEETTVFQAEFVLTEDGKYQIYAAYQDAYGNPMVAGDVVQGWAGGDGEARETLCGTYHSTFLVRDTHAPSVSMCLVDRELKEKIDPSMLDEHANRSYFDQEVYLQITVDDCVEDRKDCGNVRYQELINALSLRLVDAAGEPVRDSSLQSAIQSINCGIIEKEAFVWELPFTMDALYDVSLEGFEDLAGNRAEAKILKVAVDKKNPEIALSYEPVKDEGYVELVESGKDQILFADGAVQITVTVSDDTAGIKNLICSVTGEEDQEENLWKELYHEPTETNGWEANKRYSFTIPWEEDYGKSILTIRAEDWLGHEASLCKSVVVESEAQHQKTTSAFLETHTVPGRIVNGVPYYNTDIDYTLFLEDRYSGIRSYEVYPGDDPVISEEPKEKDGGIIYEYRKNCTLSAADNNRNDVVVLAECIDYTNHRTRVLQSYQIDLNAPILEVRYDRNDPANERYYSDIRVATITVKERNFSPDDVHFTITNTDGIQPSISGWTQKGSGDNASHICTITYEADGDYTFTMEVQDLAGNHTAYEQTDIFTIDRTKPVCTITYDNNQCENVCYYKEKRTAILDLYEHNFESSRISVHMMKDGADCEIQLLNWRSDGDYHVAEVIFDEDGAYTFTVSGADLADNSMEAWPEDFFIIDQTAPELEIRNIENHSANGGVVAPQIIYGDKNLDDTRTEVIYEGYYKGEVSVDEASGESRSSEEVVITLDDMDYIRENDDLYTLQVVVRDKAGNLAQRKIVFSVNRFGSVYTFGDENTRELFQDGMQYINSPRDIRVIETNVDLLEYKTVICSRDGVLLSMEEGAQYDVEETENEETWKQYVYTIDRCNFEKEGHYTLKLLSRDRAANTSDNDTKGKRMEFVVDTTPPSIVIADIEEDGRYRTACQKASVSIEDNIRLAEAEVYLNDVLVTTYGDMGELEARDNLLEISIEEGNEPQRLRVVACDAAGNRFEKKVENVMVTTSRFWLYLENKPLFYGSLVAVGILFAVFWLFLLFKGLLF